jgi:hypothetical protein
MQKLRSVNGLVLAVFSLLLLFPSVSHGYFAYGGSLLLEDGRRIQVESDGILQLILFENSFLVGNYSCAGGGDPALRIITYDPNNQVPPLEGYTYLGTLTRKYPNTYRYYPSGAYCEGTCGAPCQYSVESAYFTNTPLPAECFCFSGECPCPGCPLESCLPRCLSGCPPNDPTCISRTCEYNPQTGLCDCVLLKHRCDCESWGCTKYWCQLCGAGTFWACKTPPGSSYWCGCETPQFWCGRPCDSPEFNPETCECPGAGGGPCQPEPFNITPQINCDNLTLIFEVSGSVTVNYIEVYKLNPSDLQWNLLTTISDVFAPVDISKWSDGSYRFNVFLVDSCGEDREFEFNEEIACRPCPFQ